jgi:hypothetical protein
MNWDSANHVIKIDINPWPKSWSPWTTFIDGIEFPMGEESGSIIVRPNAPLDQPPMDLLLDHCHGYRGWTLLIFPVAGCFNFLFQRWV